MRIRSVWAAVVLASACACGAAAAASAAPRLVVSAGSSGATANLFVVGAGGKLKPLSASKDEQSEPAASPSGSQVAYIQAAKANCQDCSLTVWLVNATGSNGHPLTMQQPGPTIYDQSPSWSPDGSQLVFSRLTSFSYELFTVPVGGGTPHSLFIPGVDPSWGPTRIAYLSPPTQTPGPVILWTINPDGTHPTKITTSYVVTPVWSRTGNLAFLDQPPNAKPVLVVFQGGIAHRHQLSFAQASGISWAPNSDQLAIVARTTATGSDDVYSIDADGTGIRRLTTNANVFAATWSK